MLVMKDNYNKKIAPFDYDYVASKVIPVNVNISMAVMDVLSISEVDLVYVLKFRFLMVWYDYRLKYHNLKQERSLNSLSREEIERLWIPFVVFSNTQKQESTTGGLETEVTITREGNFTESPLNVMEEINIFEGDENRITFQQVYDKELKCVYQLQLYPFDTQVAQRNHICNCFLSTPHPAVHGGHGDQGSGEVDHQPGAGAGLHGERHRPGAVHHLQLVTAVQE